MTPTQCRMARAALRFTVRDLADAIEIAPSTLTLFENNKRVSFQTTETIREWFLNTGQIQFLGKEGVFVTPKAALRAQERKKAAVAMDNYPIQEDILMTEAQTLLSSRIKDLRIELGFTQTDLAIRADVDASYIHQFERGTANPSLLVLLKIAESLGTTVSEILAIEE